VNVPIYMIFEQEIRVRNFDGSGGIEEVLSQQSKVVFFSLETRLKHMIITFCICNFYSFKLCIFIRLITNILEAVVIC